MCNLFATWCTALLSNVFCIQSMNQTINYTFIAKTFLLQAVLKYFIWEICFALYMYDLYNYIDGWSTHSPYSTQRFHLRQTCCFICIVCWFFLLIFYWDIREFWVEEGNFLFSAFLRVSCVWNFESMNHFLFTLYIIRSLKCWSDSFSFVSIDLGIEKEGRGGIPRYIASCFEIAVYFIFLCL